VVCAICVRLVRHWLGMLNALVRPSSNRNTFAIQSGRERGGEEPMLVEDGLHPSAALYALWAEAAMAPARAARLWA